MIRVLPGILLLFMDGGGPSLRGQDAAPGPAQWVLVEEGDLPILLTAPHGGSLAIPEVPERSGGVRVQDDNTLELALELHRELARASGGRRPYLVAARFHRKYCDANRPLPEALESELARPVYEAYHGSVREAVTDIRARFGGEGLLLDLHGQAMEERVIFRGTGNGLTVTRLLRREGEGALTGKTSVLGLLAGRGYAVYPPHAPLRFPPEQPRYNGGFTVRNYGSHRDDGIDAIQVEVGLALRREEEPRERLARDLAEAVMAFAGQHLEAVPEAP